MNLNPFDLRGPEFLVFFTVLATVTVLAVWMLRRVLESGDSSQEANAVRELAHDPYQAAFLRGGRYEVLRVALVSLLERGLLRAKGVLLQTTQSDAAAKARRPLDKAILGKFASAQPAADIYDNQIILSEADMVGETLREHKLLPNNATKAIRVTLAVCGVLFLWAVAGTKIYVAISRGRSNIGFLILPSIVAMIALVVTANRFRTALGNRVLARVKEQFAGLRARRDSRALNQTASELTYLAALFGVASLPGDVAAEVTALGLPRKKPDLSGSSGCGSSCSGGSSCGGGGGGGGGCGGGGGGCGGCG